MVCLIFQLITNRTLLVVKQAVISSDDTRSLQTEEVLWLRWRIVTAGQVLLIGKWGGHLKCLMLEGRCKFKKNDVLPWNYLIACTVIIWLIYSKTVALHSNSCWRTHQKMICGLCYVIIFIVVVVGCGSGVKPASCCRKDAGLITLVCMPMCPWTRYWSPNCSWCAGSYHWCTNYSKSLWTKVSAKCLPKGKCCGYYLMLQINLVTN